MVVVAVVVASAAARTSSSAKIAAATAFTEMVGLAGGGAHLYPSPPMQPNPEREYSISYTLSFSGLYSAFLDYFTAVRMERERERESSSACSVMLLLLMLIEWSECAKLMSQRVLVSSSRMHADGLFRWELAFASTIRDGLRTKDCVTGCPCKHEWLLCVCVDQDGVSFVTRLLFG